MTMVTGCSSTTATSENNNQNIRMALAQKLILDLRYYCEVEELVEYKGKVSCNKALTSLPDELATLIRDNNLGGVIQFAQNLETPEQIAKLNHDMQQAALSSELGLPLFISVDQEGGRVVRLPRQYATSMSGNMAIGATYPKHGDKYAVRSGEVLGQELKSLGFNVNHGPTVDVNINADNPVINVRSFSEDPELVATLGTAQMIAMQQQGMIATLKHFPGHGDTNVDSHTGLPRVDHELAQIRHDDLLPFQHAINAGQAKMIMTAHIQYPALDDTTFVSTSGKTMVKPATMSRKILTDLLRNDMGFDGVVVTDALDMAGISHFFDETQAVIETFKAGADIALMPIKIRSPKDLDKLPKLLDALEAAVVNGDLDEQEILQSFARIKQLKSEFELLKQAQKPLGRMIAESNKVLKQANFTKWQSELAAAALTALKGNGHLEKTKGKLLLVMPDDTKCAALNRELNSLLPQLKIDCYSSFTTPMATLNAAVAGADQVLVANITPKQSAVEMGGMEDLDRFKRTGLSKSAQDKRLLELLKTAKQQNKTTYFVSLRTPYEATKYAQFSDHMIATYSYNNYVELDEEGNPVARGVTYEVLAQLLAGRIQALGQSPVTVNL